MPADPSAKSRKRSLTPRRGAIACVRCKERKAKCTPAPPGASRLPTCLNCLNSKSTCVYLDRTPNEIFLLEYVSQLETRVADLEMELSKYNPASSFTSDHSSSQKAMTAAVDALTQQYPQGPYGGDNNSPAEDHRGGQSEGNSRDPSRQRGQTDDENDELAIGVGMLSLGGLGDPLYLGASSGVNWARVCATALRRPNQISSTSRGRFAFQAPPEQASAESALSYGIENPIPPLPPPQLADQYFDLVYNHVQAQYGFLDWHALRSWHQNREQICLTRPMVGSGQGADHARGLAAFLLWLVYGYGARLMEEHKVEGAVSHEIYYSAAVACLSTLTSHHSLATVQCLLLLETYSIWHARSEISTWQVAGLALRTAIELGLHRRTRSREEREKDPLRYEMKKRVFWTVYTMDRMIALQLGRPSGIADKDIDIEFPLNIDLDVTDPKLIFEMQNRQIEMIRDKAPGEEYSRGYDQVNSMTSSIHNVRLNQLKQLIQDTIYRLDKPLRGSSKSETKGFSSAQPIPEVEAVLKKLGEWRACRPIQPAGQPLLPLLSKEQLEMDYHECVQMLLRPIIAGRKNATHYAPLCAESAASCCETDMFGPNSPSLRLVTWQLYRLFLSGLTLLHLVSSPITQGSINHDRAAQALYKSQQTVSQLVHIFPGAAQYQHVFGDLVRGWDSRRHEQMARNPQQPELQPQTQAQNQSQTLRPDITRSQPSSQGNGIGVGAIAKTSPNASSSGLPSPPLLNPGESNLSWRQTLMTGHPMPAPLDMDWSAMLASGMFGPSAMSPLANTQPSTHASHAMMGPPGPSTGSGSGSGSGSISGSGSGCGSGFVQPQMHPSGQQTLTEDMGDSWTPLFGSPGNTEAFSDQWGGTLNQMGGQLAGPMRDDFFSLLSSFGLETIVESANESSLPLTDGPIWQPPGLDAMMAHTNQPLPAQYQQPFHVDPNMPDFTNMGMGEFLDWSQRTGRTGYEHHHSGVDQNGHNHSGDGSMFDSHDTQQDERRGRPW